MPAGLTISAEELEEDDELLDEAAE